MVRIVEAKNLNDYEYLLRYRQFDKPFQFAPRLDARERIVVHLLRLRQCETAHGLAADLVADIRPQMDRNHEREAVTRRRYAVVREGLSDVVRHDRDAAARRIVFEPPFIAALVVDLELELALPHKLEPHAAVRRIRIGRAIVEVGRRARFGRAHDAQNARALREDEHLPIDGQPGVPTSGGVGVHVGERAAPACDLLTRRANEPIAPRRVLIAEGDR